jgi:anti-sigma B factor antagonist
VSAVQISTQPPVDDVRGLVSVAGDLDVAAVPELRAALLLMERSQPAALALDLREVTLLDSSGLRVLIDAAARARRDGRRLIVVAPPRGPVDRLLRLTLLTDLLEVVEDLDAAGDDDVKSARR